MLVELRHTMTLPFVERKTALASQMRPRAALGLDASAVSCYA